MPSFAIILGAGDIDEIDYHCICIRIIEPAGLSKHGRSRINPWAHHHCPILERNIRLGADRFIAQFTGCERINIEISGMSC